MARASRLTQLNVGVVSIDRMRVEDGVHLPTDSPVARSIFLPQVQALDGILARHTLDERLAQDVVPEHIASELGAPETLSATRRSLAEHFAAHGDSAAQSAAALLRHEVSLDTEVQQALAELMRG